jgi:hypothetical protein
MLLLLVQAFLLASLRASRKPSFNSSALRLEDFLQTANISVQQAVSEAQRQALQANPSNNQGQRKRRILPIEISSQNFIGDESPSSGELPPSSDFEQLQAQGHDYAELQRQQREFERLRWKQEYKDFENLFGEEEKAALERKLQAMQSREQIEAEDPVFYIEFKEFDIDYYYREVPRTPFPACSLPGVVSAICVPKEFVQEETEFCYEVNYPTVCVPVQHFLWPFWTIARKDFIIQEQVALQVEQRLILELTHPISEEAALVSDLQLTTTPSCMQGYHQFTCRYNLPFCDGDTGETFATCSNECIFFKEQCGLNAKLCTDKFYDTLADETPSCEFAPDVASEEDG